MIGSLQNEDLFKSIFRLTAEGVIALDNDATILLANPACQKLFGYNPDDLLGKNIEVLITEKHKKQLKNQILRLKNTTCSKALDLEGITNDGREFSLEIRLSYAVINGKHLTISFLKDITNQTENLQKIKQVNERLIESNQKFDALINNMKGILFRCKYDRDFTAEYISEGCLEITGYSFEDFKDKTINFGHLMLEVDRHNVWEHIQTAVTQRKAYDCEYRIQHKNGSIKYVWKKGKVVYNDQNKVIALEGFITDITAQKEIEMQLLHYEAKTKALLEAIPDMMFIQDLDGNYLDCYSNSPQKSFWPFEKCIGANMKNVLPASVYKKIKTSHKNTIATGSLQIVEYSLQHRKEIDHYEARVVLMNNHNLLTIVRNITQEKVMSAQLNIKNNALASALNSITIADAQKPNTPIIYCNSAFEKITGYKKEEVYGKNCNFLQDDDRDQEEIKIMKNAIANGKSCKVVVRNYKKDGTLFWNDLSITPVHNIENHLTHFIGVQNDVTDKIKSEELKNRTQKILELIAKDGVLKTIGNTIVESIESHITNSIATIQLLDMETKKLHLLSTLNLPKEVSQSIEGITIGPKVGSCGTAAFLKEVVIVDDIETNSLWEDYNVLPLKNGLKSCWSFPIISSKNQILGTFAIYTSSNRKPLVKEREIILDMTYLASVAIEKKQNNNALKESKKQLEQYAQKLEKKVQERTKEVMATIQKLVESNLNLEDQIQITLEAENIALESKALTTAVAKNFPMGFIIVINKDFKLVLAEGEALEQMGLKSIVFEGMTIDDVSVFAEERKIKIKEYISKTLSGIHLTFEIEYKNRYFSVNTAPLYDNNNQIMNALMVYNDISEQKNIEFSIQNALKKEQELNELKSRFVSIASHEFRTPLSAILTSAILIDKQNEPEKEEKRKKYVLQIKKNVNHLVTILNDLLSLSKLEEGNTKAVNELFDVVQFSKILVNENKVNLKKAQQISFRTTLNQLYVNLDAKLLRHVITNLLSNASKYSQENTTIDFKITQYEYKILIQIKDSGIGIPQEENEQLFNRFFRANNAKNIEGTGLGLNIAKHYTELMGGTIGFVSKLNVGTTFWVELPI